MKMHNHTSVSGRLAAGRGAPELNGRLSDHVSDLKTQSRHLGRRRDYDVMIYSNKGGKTFQHINLICKCMSNFVRRRIGEA